jgi:hypothetical protein
MTIVKFLNGDVKEYKEKEKESLIDEISHDLQIDSYRIKLITDKDMEEDEDKRCKFCEKHFHNGYQLDLHLYRKHNIKTENSENYLIHHIIDMISDGNENRNNISFFVLILESKDYPFEYWDQYLPALRAFLRFKDRRVMDEEIFKYPKYLEYVSSSPRGNLEIINKLVQTNDPQKSLNALILFILDKDLVIPFGELTDDNIIPKIIKKGAKISFEIIDKILTPDFSNQTDFVYEDFIKKGSVLSLLYPYFDEKTNEILNIYVDWDQVVPTKVTDLVVLDRNGEYDVLDERYDYKDAYYKALKYDFMNSK